VNETEWQGATDPVPMLEFLRGRASDRKLILFALACWAAPAWYGDPDWEEAIDEGLDTVLTGREPLGRLICLFGAFTFLTPPTAERWALMVARPRPEPYPTLPAQAALLRDIFGDPFRPVAVEPSWLSTTAVALARHMYESRDFSSMPILADALADAGCPDGDVLEHCRGPNNHVRGCHVVDSVLNRS
jgi:hypothetical protein